MSDMKEAAVQIRVNADGKVTLSIDAPPFRHYCLLPGILRRF